jgi:hypothetical protein
MATWAEIRERTYQVVRDVPRTFVKEDFIDMSIMEAIEELTGELPIMEIELEGTTSDGTVALPDYVRDIRYFKLEHDDYPDPVEIVDDDVFNTYQEDGATPSRTLGRVFNNVMELYPAPTVSTDYTLRYTKFSQSVVDLPRHLVPAVVYYARAQAMYAFGEAGMGDRYMNEFERRKARWIGTAAAKSMPSSLRWEPGRMDTVEGATHMGHGD